MLKFMALTNVMFSPQAKISSIQLFLTVVVIQSLHQLDIQNFCLYDDDLEEQVYTEQPLGFVSQRKYDLVRVFVD